MTSPPQHRQDICHAPHTLQETVQLVWFFLQEPHRLNFYAQDSTHLILQGWKFSYRSKQQWFIEQEGRVTMPTPLL